MAGRPPSECATERARVLRRRTSTSQDSDPRRRRRQPASGSRTTSPDAAERSAAIAISIPLRASSPLTSRLAARRDRLDEVLDLVRVGVRELDVGLGLLHRRVLVQRLPAEAAVDPQPAAVLDVDHALRADEQVVAGPFLGVGGLGPFVTRPDLAHHAVGEIERDHRALAGWLGAGERGVGGERGRRSRPRRTSGSRRCSARPDRGTGSRPPAIRIQWPAGA